MSVNPSLTQHFPVTCVIVNGAFKPLSPPLVRIYHKRLHAPSVAVCFLSHWHHDAASARFIPLNEPLRIAFTTTASALAGLLSNWTAEEIPEENLLLYKTQACVILQLRCARKVYVSNATDILDKRLEMEEGKVGCDCEGGRVNGCE